MRSLAIGLAVLLMTSCAGGNQVEADAAKAAAVFYAEETAGLAIGGLPPESGWTATDAYISNNGACAAVLLVESSETLAIVMPLYNVEDFGIPDIEEIQTLVGDRMWAPSFVPPPFSGPEITLDPYRQGDVYFGESCETLHRP